MFRPRYELHAPGKRPVRLRPAGFGHELFTVSLFGPDGRPRQPYDRPHQAVPHVHNHVIECVDLIQRKDIRVEQKRNLEDAIGGFNKAIVMCEEVGTRRKLIQKQFLVRDIPQVWDRETYTLARLRNCRFTVNMIANKCRANQQPPEAWIMLEYCNFGCLGDLLLQHVQKQRPFPETFVLRVLWSLIEAVSYMHNGGEIPAGQTDGSHGWIIHGDLHPGNVFLKTRSDDHARLDVLLADFGASHHFSSWQMEPPVGRSAAQHPYYVVPDQTWNRRSDLYQIGLIIVALCRLSPKPKETLGRGKSACGSRYSPMLNNLIASCVRSHPMDRPRLVDVRAKLHKEGMSGSGRIRPELLLS